ncbi:hypothetical protein GJ629_02085 [Halapricum sp. CBA1109]|uniref:class I SAM-dependent methyltransferase n=1 Tax=Halapricum sp. CBA1109 TaxID=2668068 RepID=UPI0012FC76AC|nr:class I SAM-dependent methyltransferase [Halapricum sp. CBA1109]MUV88828.1 hypothetical protein [Halapricum sp. CBA1109]
MVILSVVTRLFGVFPDRLQRYVWELAERNTLLLWMRVYFTKGTIFKKKGWFESSVSGGVPVDGSGNPTPWYTYSAIDFLDERISRDLRVFEYGGGYSTIWYAQRVEEVIAVEDSKEWTEIVTKRLPRNGEIVYRDSKKEYTGEILNREKFDIVVIDGSYRTDCVESSLKSLSDQGVIIWDDFDWLDEDDYQLLIEDGFSVLPFRGLKAGEASYKCTAIFYRENNCLGI